VTVTSWPVAWTIGLACAGALVGPGVSTAPPPTPSPPPANAPADYQLGGDYEPPAGVVVVTRDWFAGAPLVHRSAIGCRNPCQPPP